MPFKSDKQRAFLWSQKPDVARQIAYKQSGGGVYGSDVYDQSAKWWNQKMAGTPQHVGFVDDPDNITEAAATNPDDPYGGKFFNPNRQQPTQGYTDLATYYTPDTRQMGRGAQELARIDKNNAALAKKAKEMNFKFNDGGMVPPLGDGRKPSKVTQKDRYGNQVTYEFLPEVKPLDQTALAKQAMEMSMEGGVPPMMQMEVGMMADGGHPGEPRGTDTVPAWLTPGEFVVNKEAVDMYGPAIKKMNDHGRQVQSRHMQEGGWVEALSNPSFYRFAERKPTALELVQQSARASLEGEEPSEVPGRTLGGLWDALRQIPLKRQEGGNVPLPMSPTEALLRAREGYRDDVYLDSLKKPTVGHGHLLPDEYKNRVGERPFSKSQLDSWFRQDMNRAKADAKANAKKYGVDWSKLNKREKTALTSQAFQLGKTGQSNFENMWTALAAGDKETAALEALDSAWGSQTPERAKDLYNALTPGLGFQRGGPIYAYRGYDTAMQDAADIEDPLADLSSGWVPPVAENTDTWDAGDAALMENYEELQPSVPPDSAYEQNLAQQIAMAENMVAGGDGDDLGTVDAPPPVEEPGAWDSFLDWATDTTIADARNAGFDVKVAENNLEAAKAELAELEARANAEEPVNQHTLDGARAAVAHQEAELAQARGDEAMAEAALQDEAVTTMHDDLVEQNQPGPEDDLVTLEELAESPEFEEEDDPSKESEKGQQSTEQVIAEGEEAAKKNPDLVAKAKGFFAGAFSDLFDGKELARMAIMYVGSRALGYSHGGSLNWAAKQYVTRLDAKHTARDSFIQKNAKNYSAASLQKYKETGDLSVLEPLGAAPTTTGNTMTRVVNGKRTSFQEVKVGDNTMYRSPSGQLFTAADVENGTSPYEPAFEKGTPEYRARRSRATNDAAGRFEEVWKADDRFRVGDNEWKTTTNIRPKQAADEFWAFMEENGMDPESDEALGVMTNAYKQAIVDAKNNPNMKVNSLKPYLQGELIREKTGSNELFVSNPDRKEGEPIQYVRGDKMALLNRDVRRIAPQFPDWQGLDPEDAASRFYDDAIQDWGDLPADEQKLYRDSAEKGESGFYYWLLNIKIPKLQSKLNGV